MKFSPFWNHIPQLLFPRLERVFAEALTEEHKKIIAILEVVRIEECIHQNRSWTGRPAYDWVPFARFFVAKAILNVAATCDMIARVEVDINLRRILGWELGKRLPDESAFSRVNATLACLNIPLRAQEALANAQVKDRGICHTAHDSSAIKARETARNTRKSVVVKARKRGRPRKGESVVQKVPSGVERYLPMTPGEMEREIPKACNWGGKTNSQGKYEYWKGYKLHVSVVSGGLPVACLLTSASVHDSQAAPFLIKKTARKVQGYYLADAAYDSAALKTLSGNLGLVPIIDENPRRNGEKTPMEPDRARRYKDRTMVERFFARLKDEFGARMIYVRGNRKVFAHLMYGVLALMGDQLLQGTP